jgi:ATP-binding protein involved in chromosome partitioning
MFEKVNVPVIGIVENMAYFTCGNCNTRHEVFSHGGGAEAARKFEVPFLGEIPIEVGIREGGDAGVPVVVGNPTGPVAEAFRRIAGDMARQLSILAYPAVTP